MEIKLTNEESEEYFCNALCNSLSQLRDYGLTLDYNTKEYKAAAEKLKESKTSAVCFEDVLMEILRTGGSISLIDEEGDGEMNSSITIKDVHELVATTPTSYLTDMINEEDDADTGDVLLQTVFYKSIIFG